MKIDFAAVLTDFAGGPLKTDDRPVTLGHVTLQALGASYPDETPDGARSVRRFEIGSRVATTKGKVELTVEEAAEIKKVIGKAFGPVVVGPAYLILEGEQARAGDQ